MNSSRSLVLGSAGSSTGVLTKQLYDLLTATSNRWQSMTCRVRQHNVCHNAFLKAHNTGPVTSFYPTLLPQRSVATYNSHCGLMKSSLPRGRHIHVTCTRRKSSTDDVVTLNKKQIETEDMTPVKTSEIKSFLNEQSLSHHDGYTCFVTTCPRHSRRRLKLSHMENLFINQTTGYFACHKCKRNGSWNQFKSNTENIMDAVVNRKRLPSACEMNGEPDSLSRDLDRATGLYNRGTPVEDVSVEEVELMMRDHGAELLSLETLTKFKVRVNLVEGSVILPVCGLGGAVVGVKVITRQKYSVQENARERIVSHSVPRLEQQGLFGWHLIHSHHKTVVLTANEWDAMLVHQSASVPTLAMPRGDSVLPQRVLPLLEQFEKVILWFGGDMKTWQAAKHFARKLNESRCYVIRPGEKQPSPMQAALRNLSVSAIIRGARAVKHKSITSFRHLRHEVYAQLAEAEQMSGIKWSRYPQLNKLLKGHRRGELTVFTGPTGSGKTTFISDYSLDLAQQGVNTLWGSFEINNVKLMKTMLTQFAQLNLVKHLDQFNHYADLFETLPMYFMTFYGQEQIQTVIETMSHAVYVHDIAHVIVDNLQFMLGLDKGSDGGRMGGNDRYFHQDKVIAAFRKFATHMNCHVTLVIHPRKERESDDLAMSSIFGSAKASQESDNVLILQDKRLVSPRGRKYIQIAKNRYDGELGVMLLKFDKDTLSYSLKTAPKERDIKDTTGVSSTGGSKMSRVASSNDQVE